MCIQPNDVGFLLRENLRNVLQQARTVVRHHIKLNSEDPLAGISPTGLHQAGLAVFGQMKNHRAIIAMNGDAMTLRDVSNNRIGRSGLAATGHLRQQAGFAFNQNATGNRVMPG